MTSLTIGMFSPDFAYKYPFERDGQSWGGVGEVIYQLSTHLAEAGYRVKIFTVSDRFKHEVHDSVEVFEYPATFSAGEHGLSLPYLAAPLLHSIDIVHVHRGLPSGALSGHLYSRIKGKPLLFTCHGEINKEGNGVLGKLLLSGFESISGRLLNHADNITTVSQSFLSSSEYLEEYKVETEVIPNGVTPPSLNISKVDARHHLGLEKDATILLYIGSLVERKNPERVLSIADKIACGSNHDLTVVMAGSGVLRKQLEQRATSLSEINVQFMGFVSEHKKEMLYASADVFFQPSTDESFGLTVLEAMAFGLPVVTSNLQCFQEIVPDAQGGFVCHDFSEMVEKTNILIQDKSKRVEFSQAARQSAEQYSWEKITQQYIDAYREIL